MTREELPAAVMESRCRHFTVIKVSNEMENENILTTSNMELMVSWLRGEGESRPEFAERFMTTMHLLYMNKAAAGEGAPARRRRTVPRGAAALSLRAMLGEASVGTLSGSVPAAEPRLLDVPDNGGDTGTEKRKERNSMEVAAAICDIHRRIQGGLDRPREMTMSFLQAVLYMVYGILLSLTGERIVDEYPQMWKYGPVFARVYARGDKVRGMAPGAGDSLRKEDPRLYSLIDGVIRSGIDRGMRAVSGELISAGSPWKRCHDENPGKWGTVIADELTSAWFSRRSGTHARLFPKVNPSNISA